MKIRIAEQDIIYLSYDEPNAEKTVLKAAMRRTKPVLP